MHQHFIDMFDGSELGIRFRTYGRIDEVGPPMITAPVAAPTEPAAAEPAPAVEAPAAPVSDLEAESAAKAVQPLPEEPPTQAEAGAAEIGAPPVAEPAPAPAAAAPEMPATAHEAIRQDKQADAATPAVIDADASAVGDAGVEASAVGDAGAAGAATPPPKHGTSDVLDGLPPELRDRYTKSRDRAIDAWMPRSAPAADAPTSNFFTDAMDQLRRMVEELAAPKQSGPATGSLPDALAEVQHKLDAQAQRELLDKLQRKQEAAINAWR